MDGVPLGESQPDVRVLVVDDEPNITELISTVLRYEGWEVQHCCHRRRAALTAVRAFRAATSMVLDVMLPDLDGFEVLQPAAP